MDALRLIASILITVALSAGLTVLQKFTPYGKLKPIVKQLAAGVVLGAAAIVCTHLSFETGTGAAINARDGAIVSAGLLFGPFAGLMAGAIGGIERYFATVFWGIGAYTQVACTVSAAVSGALSALCSAFLFKKEKPSALYALGLGVTAEVFHMLTVFFAHMDDLSTASEVVEQCAIWIILASGSSAALSALAVSLIEKKKAVSLARRKELSYALQIRLLAIVAASLLFTLGFTVSVQTGLALRDAETGLGNGLNAAKSYFSDDDADYDPLRHSGRWLIWTDGGVIAIDGDGTVLSDLGGHKGEKISELVTDGKYEALGEMFYAVYGGTPCYCMCVKSGDETAEYLFGYIPESEVMYYRDIAVYMTVFAEIIIFAAVFVALSVMTRRLVVKNIDRINSTLGRITDGKLDERADVEKFTEFKTLSDDINSTVDTLKRYIDNEAARIDAELAFARSVQHSALPSVFPPYPLRSDFDIFAVMDAAKEVGGDFYDFYFVGENSVAFLVADVSDKGIAAAMFMMRAKTVIKNLAESGLSPAEVMEKANARLCENNDAGMFVTAWLGIIELGTGRVVYCSAGHNPPAGVFGGEVRFVKSKPGLVLGGMDGVKYKNSELTLKPNDRIVLYTDGVTEATAADGELFGERRLHESIERAAEFSARALVDAIKEDIAGFIDGAPQFDDTTILVLDYFGSKGITVEAKTENVPKIAEYVENALETAGAPKEDVTRILIAVDEAVANVVSYAYGGGAGFVNVTADFDKKTRGSTLTVTDSGKAFDPLKIEVPDVSLSAEERKIGGLGVHIIKGIADETNYEYRMGRNILTLRKKSAKKASGKRK